MLTIAIVAHNEELHIDNAIRQAHEAADHDTHVLVVDSASTDRTAERARELRCEVLTAPLGKGAAMAAAARATTTAWLCFMDADIIESQRNIPLTLRHGIEQAPEGTAMVIADFDDPPPKPILSATIALYAPLVRALIPEAENRFGSRPLSGFRAIRPWLIGVDAPGDFGIEAYLNVTAALTGQHVVLTHIGMFKQRFRYKSNMGWEIADAILDAATAHGRLASGARDQWDRWVERVLSVIRGYHGEESAQADYLDHLTAAAGEPLPPRFL